MCALPVVFSPFSPCCRTKNVSSVFRLPYALFMYVMVVYCVKNFCFCRVLGHARLRNPGSTSIRNDTSGPGAVRRSHHKPRSTAGRPGVRARDLVIDRPVPHHVSGAAAVLARDGRQATGEKVSFFFFFPWLPLLLSLDRDPYPTPAACRGEQRTFAQVFLWYWYYLAAAYSFCRAR